MKQLRSEHTTCTICNAPLKWWNTQSCMDCGKVICSRHACALKRQHSSVLHSYCVHCSSHHTNVAINVHKQNELLHI